MPESRVEFYAIPGSLAAGECPVLRSGQIIDGYKLASFVPVKATRDLVQTIGPVPYFTGAERANMCRIMNDWYWITNYKTQSLQTECVTFGVTYNPVMSNLRMSQSLTGVWTRTPTERCSYMHINLLTDAMKYSRSIELPTIRSASVYSNAEFFWCEIAGMITTSNSKKIVRYGFFIASDRRGKFSKVKAQGVSSTLYYPSIDDLFSSDSVLGILPDEIINISVSARCPYLTSVTYQSPFYYINVMLSSTTYIEPIEIDGMLAYDFRYFTTDLNEPMVNLSLTNDERNFGVTHIVNESGVVIANIPHQYGGNYNFKVRTITDISGITTEVLIDNRVITTIPEGHIPWIGSSWEGYQARMLEGDRQLTALANEQASADLNITLQQSKQNQIFREVDLAMSAASSANIFNPIGAIVGAGGAIAGALEAEAQGQLEREALITRNKYEQMSNDLNQQLTEKQMISAPGTAYAAGYGLTYIQKYIHHPARIQVEMPANFTTNRRIQYFAEFGYPCEGNVTVPVEPGFIQGKILNRSNNITTGPRFDELARVLATGIKIVEVPEE